MTTIALSAVQPLTFVAVIGTSGKLDAEPLTPEHFATMKRQTLEKIETEFKLQPLQVCLVSGGSAWADHVAVHLFLEEKVAGLILHVPCYLHPEGHGFERNCFSGSLLNARHKEFSEAIKKNSLRELSIAVERGAKVVECRERTFYARNTTLATACSYLIAFTFGTKNAPSSPGTLDTWNKCPDTVVKVHIPLSKPVPKKWLDKWLGKNHSK